MGWRENPRTHLIDAVNRADDEHPWPARYTSMEGDDHTVWLSDDDLDFVRVTGGYYGVCQFEPLPRPSRVPDPSGPVPDEKVAQQPIPLDSGYEDHTSEPQEPPPAGDG